MNYKWITSFLPLSLLVGCNSEAIEITSDTVPKQQIQTIIDNINKHYPEASNELKQHAADVVVRAIENMVFVEGGSFEMGDFLAPCDIPSRTKNRIDWTPEADCLTSPSSEETGAYLLHKVTLDDYFIAKYETTFMDMEWMRQINGLPVAADDMKIPISKVIDRNSDRYNFLITKFPNSAAMTKSWRESQDYCAWLSEISTLPFSLPTEAQWEYAARNRGKHVYFGTSTGYRQTRYPYFNTSTKTHDEYKESEINALNSPETSVDQLPPNPLGIYGMSNQIREWLYDWYSQDYYQNSPKVNPMGPDTGTLKVLRDAAGVTMTFDRIYSEPVIDGYYNSVSFRCALH
jgi:formylglycine-generating enzyme